MIGGRFFSVTDCELKCDGLSNTLWTMFNECFPLISVRISSRDPPFISPLVKHLLKFRNRLLRRSKRLPVGLEDRINHLIRENQRHAVMQDSCMSGRGSRAWWSTVNTITGRDTEPQLISSVIHPDIINKYFCSISSDPEYIAPAPIDIPNGARIPKIPLQVVTSFLSRLKRTAVARMSSHTGFLEISPMILPLLLLMCLTARCDNIKYHPLGRWQTSSLY